MCYGLMALKIYGTEIMNTVNAYVFLYRGTTVWNPRP